MGIMSEGRVTPPFFEMTEKKEIVVESKKEVREVRKRKRKPIGKKIIVYQTEKRGYTQERG